jgi:hypothetical protein
MLPLPIAPLRLAAARGRCLSPGPRRGGARSSPAFLPLRRHFLESRAQSNLRFDKLNPGVTSRASSFPSHLMLYVISFDHHHHHHQHHHQTSPSFSTADRHSRKWHTLSSSSPSLPFWGLPLLVVSIAPLRQRWLTPNTKRIGFHMRFIKVELSRDGYQ